MNAASSSTDSETIEPGFALFETAIGTCALAWGPRGLVGVQLPEENGEAATRARMRLRFADLFEAEPPDSARRAIAAIQGLLSGE
ncbi:MAG: cysteine methyltransferase, partial [Variovorax paradoxus]|nr:cysteine methyltransferase [Variovorax paradoxus]